jgi:colanic acid/amylovoran biosynthesis protein
VARDALALDEAREVMARDHDVRLTPDVAFAGWTAVAAPRLAQGDRPRVGIVTMDWTWARRVDPALALDAYVEKLAAVARALVARGFEVRFYGHSLLPEMGQDDLVVAHRVVAAVDDPHAFVDPLGVSGDVDHLHSLFASLAVVIGTRLHSCIIAMSAGTPAIGLAYQPKTLGTYRLLGLEELCLDVEAFDPDAVIRLATEVADPSSPRRNVVTERVEATRLEVTGFYRELLCAS